MEAVLVGAPGSGGRSVGGALAERHGASFIDLTGEPARHVDAISGLHRAAEPDAGPDLRRVIAADRAVADPGLRARLYRGRHVIWLDVPSDRLLERLRTMRREDLGIQGDLHRYLTDHLSAYAPYYFAGARVDGSGSISTTIAAIEPILAEPPEPGTLMLRAEIHGGFVELGEGTLGSSLRHVVRRLSSRRGVVVTSPRSRRRAAQTAKDLASGSGVVVEVLELPDGERSKQVDSQEGLLRTLANHRFERKDPIIAVGDDLLLEAATFAAAVFLRGVPLVTIPDTTLGMIDTSIGGKGGLDLPGLGRNLLGAIHQPTATILDIDLVQDEAGSDRRAALAEAVKYALIGDDALLALLEGGALDDGNRPWLRGSALLELVERCALAKRRLVIPDERDTDGVRVALNLGHTVSHALEAATGYQIRHGEAVAYGLRAALRIGVSLGVTPEPVARRAERLLSRLRLAQVPVDVPVISVLGYIQSDKKRKDAQTRWVLVGANGIMIRDDVPVALVEHAVASALSGGPPMDRRGGRASTTAET
jgi:3-dehydroquinate synthetase